MKAKQIEPFTIGARLKSFKYAFNGLWEFVRTQHNAWIHLIAIIVVVFLGVWCDVTTIEWLWLVLAIGMVLMAEIFNTSIEYLVDFVSPEYNAKAGLVKDLAAGAVIVAAVTAAIIGIIIFSQYTHVLFNFLPL